MIQGKEFLELIEIFQKLEMFQILLHIQKKIAQTDIIILKIKIISIKNKSNPISFKNQISMKVTIK